MSGTRVFVYQCLVLELTVALVSNPVAFRRHVKLWAAKYLEIFPLQITAGFWFHDFVASRKLNLRMRRIRLLETGHTNSDQSSSRPTWLVKLMKSRKDCTCDFDMGYHLMLWHMRLGVMPVTGTEFARHWDDSPGVGTTVKKPEAIPVNLIADEKHSWLLGERIYISTTVASGCFLGVNIVKSADTQALVEGYERFRAEAVTLKSDYRPATVNTDGWEHTQAAWQTLFPGIHFVLCFLHAVLSIQQCCRRTPVSFRKVTGRLWHVYKAPTNKTSAQPSACADCERGQQPRLSQLRCGASYST